MCVRWAGALCACVCGYAITIGLHSNSHTPLQLKYCVRVCGRIFAVNLLFKCKREDKGKKEGRKREERGEKGKKGGKKGYAWVCVWVHGSVRWWVRGREGKRERVRACVRVCVMFVSLVAMLVVIQSNNSATTYYTRACM